jgi:hypothetical protein
MKTLQLNNTSITLPSKWNELTHEQFISVCSITEKFDNINELRLVLLLKITGIYVFHSKSTVLNGEKCFKIMVQKKQIGWISTTDLAYASTVFDFLFRKIKLSDGNFQYAIESQLTTNLLPEIQVKKQTLYGPDDGLTNLIFSEFINAETYLSRFRKTNDEKWLNKFIAVLYRTGKIQKEIKDVQFNGDHRKPFNEALNDDISKLTSKISVAEKKGILFFYDGCKAFIAGKYPHVFEKSDGNGPGTDPFQGFIDLVGTIAENKPAEKPKIRQQLLFDILDSLEKMRIQAIEMEEKYLNK